MRLIVTQHPEHEFYFLFDRRPDTRFIFAPNVHPVVLCPPARHPLLWTIYFEWSVACALRRYKIDLFVTPDGYMPLHGATPTVAVIHDLNFEHDSSFLRPSHQRYMNRNFNRFARRAARIATVSEYSKADIERTYGIAPERIDVVYNGSNSHYCPHNEEQKAATRNKVSGGERYFLFVSTILKRKNLAGLLRAYDIYKGRTNDGTKLVVVGHRVWWQDELKAAYEQMKHSGDVIFIGHADVAELADIMAAAEALVYPSMFEGFGIPIIEAFSAGTPVITSNVTSMPEIAGDAALLIDPRNPAGIADAMLRVGDPATRSSLIERGHRQGAKFSWQRTSDLLWQSMMKTCNKQ